MRETSLTEGRRGGTRVEGGKFPPAKRKPISERQIRRPLEVATSKRPRVLHEPSPAGVVALAGGRDPMGNDKPVQFHDYGPSDPLTKALTNAADMSGADTEGDVILMSFNWNLDVSTDGGGSWKRLDPTTIFPNDFATGFCCDQILTYVPTIDRFVWFLQYGKDSTGQGAFRLAVSSPSQVKKDPTAWTYWDFVAGDFGFATSDMDYPDLSFSESFLFLSTDVFSAGGRLVVRITLKELQSGGSIGYGYTDPARSTTAWGGHLVQQTTSQAVWLGQKDNSTLEVFTCPDGGNTYSSTTISVAAWPNGTMSSTGPDGNDWLTKLRSFPSFAVTGGVQRRNGHVVVAWTASNGKGSSNGFTFPQTHCRVVELDLTHHSVVSEMQIWNPNYAFAYPSLAINAADEVGVLLGWGGSSDHANCAMGIIGDYVVWFRDDSTRTVQRFGDYLTTRPARRQSSLFAGFGYWVEKVTGNTSSCTYHPFYCRYGR